LEDVEEGEEGRRRRWRRRRSHFTTKTASLSIIFTTEIANDFGAWVGTPVTQSLIFTHCASSLRHASFGFFKAPPPSLGFGVWHLKHEVREAKQEAPHALLPQIHSPSLCWYLASWSVCIMNVCRYDIYIRKRTVYACM
jgi:hypothetical protein